MSLPTPNTRKEQYLNAIATGNAGGLPTPITREEEYLNAIAKSGGGSGEGDMKKSVYDSDFAVSEAGGIGAFVNSAVAGKVDKVEGKGLSTNDYDDTEKGKVADNASAIEAIVNVTGSCNILNSSKNFIVNPNSGVTFDVNADGSVTINGTATANTAIVFVFDRIDYDVIMKSSSDDIVINFDPLDGDWQVGTDGQIAHGLNANGFSLNVYNGNTINNVTVYPMLYDARLNPTGYVPYAMTNKELTERVNRGSVSVTADGVKDTGALFDELMALVAKHKLSSTSYVIFGNNCYRWQYTGSTLNIPFTQVYVEIDKLYVNTLRYTTGGSAWYQYTSTNGVQNKTSEVLPSGYSITLYY